MTIIGEALFCSKVPLGKDPFSEVSLPGEDSFYKIVTSISAILIVK